MSNKIPLCRITQGAGKDGLLPENDNPQVKGGMPPIQETEEEPAGEERMQEPDEVGDHVPEYELNDQTGKFPVMQQNLSILNLGKLSLIR